MSALSSLALPHVASLHAYTPGLQPTEPGWVKLTTNECPSPPSPRVAEALRRGASFYLPGYSVPMLPRALSEDLVSLGPNAPRRPAWTGSVWPMRNGC